MWLGQIAARQESLGHVGPRQLCAHQWADNSEASPAPPSVLVGLNSAFVHISASALQFLYCL